jgi:hypothetical protein
MGVKSLWTIIREAGVVVDAESLNGKVLAIGEARFRNASVSALNSEPALQISSFRH